jgi:hypothetical protein
VCEVGGSVGEKLEAVLLERVLGHRLPRPQAIRLRIQLLIQLYMCPHTTIYVPSYCYIRVLAILRVCADRW